MQYNVFTLTENQLRELIRSGDDSRSNQIRIKDSGEIFLSQLVGADHIEGIKARFETFGAHNGYVGEGAASDDRFIKGLFQAIQDWIKNPVKTYIDVWKW